MASTTSRVWRPIDSSTARARWPRPVPRVMPTIVPRAYGSHHGLPRPVKAGTRKHALGVGHGGGQRRDLVGRLDDAEAVAQPLHGGAGHEDGALERVRGASPSASVQPTVVSSPSTGLGTRRRRRSSARTSRCRRCSWSCPARGRPGRTAPPAGRRRCPTTGMPAGTPGAGGGDAEPAARRPHLGQRRRRHPEAGRAARPTTPACGCRRASCGWRWTGRWRARRRRARRSGSTAPRSRPCRGPDPALGPTPPSVSSHSSLVAAEVRVEHEPGGRRAQSVRGLPRGARRSGQPCGGPATRWRGAAAARCDGPRRRPSRAGR